MMTDTKYNGWTNYATWRVNLEVFDGFDPFDNFSDDQANMMEWLPDTLKEYAEEIIEQTLVTLEKNKAHVDECKEKIIYTESPATKRSLEWDLTSHVNDVAKTERRLKMAYKERDNFLKILNEMYETGEAYLSDGRDMKDSLFDEELSEQLEAEHWVLRLGKQAALDLISYGHIGTGNLEAISMLDEETAIKTLRLAMTYSHTVKKSLGIMEQSIIEAIESGQIPHSLDIEKQNKPKEIE
jgi:hypothetical protein